MATKPAIGNIVIYTAPATVMGLMKDTDYPAIVIDMNAAKAASLTIFGKRYPISLDAVPYDSVGRAGFWTDKK